MDNALTKFIETAYELLTNTKAAFKTGDMVIFRVPGLTEVMKIEEVYTNGTHVNDGDEFVATRDDPVYRLRVMERDQATGEYKPTSKITMKRTSQLKPYTPAKESESVPESEVSEYKFTTCSFYKAADGSLYVYGIYSSYYLDSDKDILTAKAHQYFADGVNKGNFPYPDIYVAHINVPVGKCQMIDYHTDGFAVFGGEIYKAWQDVVEEVIIKSVDAGIELGLSHGFLNSTVEYDEEGYMVKYISHEVSILPLFAHAVKNARIISASNKYTALLSE